MAVKVDIPGFGTVEAENAASEETLRSILEAMQAAQKAMSGKAGANPQNKASQDAAKSTKDLAKGAKDAAEDLTKISVGWAAAGDAAMSSLKNLGVTATAVAVKFMTNYADIADNPIKAGRDLINTGIDVVGDFAQGLAKAIPFVGEAASAAAKLAQELLKAANNVFADQLQKNVDALQSYNKVGASFSGGMQQMSDVAHAAGLGIKDFSSIVAKNKEELNKFGLSGGDAAQRLAEGLGSAAKTIGKSGQNLRTEMFKMGYTYEEQGAVMTSFMANMQAAGKLRAMSDKEIAEGTRKYATDLKVIADITGQDAKKLMERARAEAQRGALMTKLTGDQKTAFMSANSVLSKAGPEVQAALTQYLTFGNITDPKIAANKAMVDMVKSVGEQVKAGNTDIATFTDEQARTAAKKIATSQGKFTEAIDRAAVAGVQGTASGMADISNKFMAAYGPDPDVNAAKKSQEANEAQANATDDLSTKTAALYDSTKQFQVLMETKVNKNLDTYAKLLEKVNAQTMKMIGDAIEAVSGPSPEKAAAEKAALEEYKKQYGGLAEYQMAQDKRAMEVKQKREAEIAEMSAEDAAKARKYDENLRKAFGAPQTNHKNIYEERMKGIDVPQMAFGGVTAGPNSGYQAVLHGTEAVIPLPDGKSVPVEIKQQTAGSADSSQSSIQAMVDEIKNGHSQTYSAIQDLVRAMKQNNNLTSGILQHSY